MTYYYLCVRVSGEVKHLAAASYVFHLLTMDSPSQVLDYIFAIVLRPFVPLKI
jgi:hypothetical protein